MNPTLYGLVTGLATWLVLGILTSGSKESSLLWAASAFWGVIVGVVTAFLQNENKKERDAKARREQLESEEQARREHKELQRRIFAVRQLCSEAQSAALSLPTILAAAELDSDRAELELNKRRYSPFWEAVEDATAKLNSFDQTLHLIAERKALHHEQSKALGEFAPVFSLGNVILPDPASIHSRLRALYLRAQEDHGFADIYEQRRNTAKLDQTNAILVAGFRSLNDAIQVLGDRMVHVIENLRVSLGFQLGSIQVSLESAATVAAEQRSALLAEIRQSNDTQAEILQQQRQNIEILSEHERVARRMRDNIQRKRKPTIFDTG